MVIKIASSATIEGMQALINTYFYSSSFNLIEYNKELYLFNSKGLFFNGYAIKKGKRFIFYQYK
jgi:hypothetical protein